MFRLVRSFVKLFAGCKGRLCPKGHRKHYRNYLTDGNFFNALTTIFVAVEPCFGIARIGLCSNESTETLNLDNFITDSQT